MTLAYYKMRVLLKSARRKGRVIRSLSHLPPKNSYLPCYILPTAEKVSHAIFYANSTIKKYYELYSLPVPNNRKGKKRTEPFWTGIKIAIALSGKLWNERRIRYYMESFRPRFYRITTISEPQPMGNLIIDMTLFHNKYTCRAPMPDWHKIIRQFLTLAPYGARLWVLHEYFPFKLFISLRGKWKFNNALGCYIKQYKKEYHLLVRNE